MRIGIDIDDTITETSSLIEQIIYENQIKDMDSDFDSYSNDILKSYDDIIRENIDLVMKECPIKKDAVEVIKYLKDLGHDIYIITARNNHYSDNVIDLTVSFFKEHGIIYDKILFDCDEKKSVCLNNKIDIMLDDKGSFIESLKGTSVRGVLFSNSYNLKYDCERVSNWIEFQNIVEDGGKYGEG